jgi:hypothetical protein
LIIRAYSATLYIDGAASLPVPDIYNHLIADQHIVPAETRIDGLERDLFELYEYGKGAIQGMWVEFDVVNDMRSHVLEVRRQAIPK